MPTIVHVSNMANLTCLGLLICILSGCNSNKINHYSSYLKDVPVQAISSDQALIYIYAKGSDMSLRVDGEEVGELEGKTYTYFYLDPGEHYIVYYDGLITSRKLADINQEFLAGRIYHLEKTPKSNIGTSDGELVAYSLSGNKEAPQMFAEISDAKASMLRKKLGYSMLQ